MKKNSLINRFVETATLKRALLATLLFGIMTYIIDYSPIGVAGLLKLTNGANILDFENGYPLETGYGMLEALGQAGRDFYLFRIMPTDIFFPISVMLFFSCWMALFLKYLTKPAAALRALPLLAVVNMLCDWGENVGIAAMLVNYPAKLVGVCTVSSAITQVKFVCVKLVALTTAVLLLCTAVKWVRQRLSASRGAKKSGTM